MTILVTGASGFIGRNLLMSLAIAGNKTIGVVRFGSLNQICHDSIGIKQIGALNGSTDWSGFFGNVSSVVHCAAVAHGKLGDAISVNVEGTLNLAQQAASAGVQRFVFISSIGVNGNINTRPFTTEDTPAPAEPYAQSKWEAERGLQQLCQHTGMELVIIRPPLVYGPGAPGNFGSLVRIVEKGLPLPLGAVHNKRSLVALDNLVDLIITCIDHPSAANQLFLVSDGEDLSTSGLLRRVAKAMGKPSRLIPVPAVLLQLGATVLGKKAIGQRLLGSLQVDISSTRERLDWTPPVSVDEGLRRCFETQGH